MTLDPTLNCLPQRLRSVHLMGVGGVAMGALAGALADRGLDVRGSDGPLYPPMSTFLAAKGVPVAQGYDPANLDPPPDLVVVGNVIRRDNPEAQELARRGLCYLSLPQALAELFIADKTAIVIAGTHGKTTTTALTASGLLHAGAAPGFLVGGVMIEGGRNFADGRGAHFVVEGDEYDTAFFDKRPKFVHYRPKIGVLTSVEFDHADIYADLDAVRVAFDQFAALIPPEGVLIAWGDDPEVLARAQKARCPVQTYGQGPQCLWRLLAARPSPQGGALIELQPPGGPAVEFYSPLAGRHNALNACAAVAAMTAGGVALAEACRVQGLFQGVRRRQEVRGRAGGVTVVDDFAHHPTAVRETIAAVADFGLPGWRPGDGRLIAVFEPRTNTSKTNHFQAEYATAFDRADLVLLREPPGAEAIEASRRFSSTRLAQDLAERGLQARALANGDGLLAELLAELRPGDLCLIMSNGAFEELHARLLAALA
ncbi:UDP-N-acetylmuramate--L-alanine ligase [Desulfarculus baarsii]